jgi:hypothetical protein
LQKKISLFSHATLVNKTPTASLSACMVSSEESRKQQTGEESTRRGEMLGIFD